MGDPTQWVYGLIATHLAALAAMVTPPIARHLIPVLRHAGHRTEQATEPIRYRAACVRLYLSTTVRGPRR